MINKISFPRHEWKDIEKQLKEKGTICTTRVDKEFNKYKLMEIYSWRKYKLKTVKIKIFNNLKEHPYYKQLSKKNIADLTNKKYKVIWLRIENFSKIL
jgi:predicted methyltransferase